MKIVEDFTGYFEFLSLEFSCPVAYQGYLYNSCAHAYAAAKVTFITEKCASDLLHMDGLLRRIQKAPTLSEVRQVLNILEAQIESKNNEIQTQ